MIKVLAVEDDPMVMDITCKYVESIPGFEIIARASGSGEASRILAEAKIDMMILDIFMPGTNGVDFLADLRNRGSLVDVIFLTAANDTEMINRALKLGLVDYLIKPFSYERFKTALVNYQKVQELMHQRKATQEQLDSTLKSLDRFDSARIHKGMHPKTLESIRQHINSLPDSIVITQNDIARQLGLSRVTVRRYLEYMTAANEVAMEIEYGAVGRPSYTYRKMR